MLKTATSRVKAHEIATSRRPLPLRGWAVRRYNFCCTMGNKPDCPSGRMHVTSENKPQAKPSFSADPERIVETDANGRSFVGPVNAAQVPRWAGNGTFAR